MAKPNLGGRPSIFGSKAGGDRVQGNITKSGSKRFEEERRRLAAIVSWETEKVSDADVIEFMARGETATREFLAKKAGR